MRVTHHLTIVARCPHGGMDTYQARIEVERVVLVERIRAEVARLTKRPIYQEALTAKLARALGAKVTTEGMHGDDVRTEVVAS